MNKEVNIAVCDDDEIVCEAICSRICKIFKSCGITVSCDKYISPVALYKNINERQYDVLFLDIDMPKLSGIELAKIIRKDKNETDIVFVSNREDKVFETFPVRPFGFVRKNNFTHDLNDIMRSYINVRILSNSYVAFRTANNSVTRKVKVSDIVYIESFRYKQYVYLSDGEQFEIHMTMKELETKLEEYDIIRVYQGYLVNLKYVQRIDRAGIVLNYNESKTINISREKVQEVKALYINYLRKMGTLVFDENG